MATLLNFLKEASISELGLAFFCKEKGEDSIWPAEFKELESYYNLIVKGWHEKRRSEFLEGRLLIHTSLKADGHQFWNLPVGIGENREPLFDFQFSGALTHNKNYIIFAYALGQKSVGVDVEQKERAKKNIEHQILSDEDKLQEGVLPNSNEFLTLVFSAKESCYKALYPFFQEYFGMKDAYLSSVNGEDQSFEIVVTKTFKKRVGHGPLVLKGRYLMDEENIFTYILPIDKSEFLLSDN